MPDHPKLVPAMSMPDDKPDTPAPRWPMPFADPILYVDCETTGLNREYHRLLEVAVWQTGTDALPVVFRFGSQGLDEHVTEEDEKAGSGRKASDVTGYWERKEDFANAPTFHEQREAVAHALCPPGGKKGTGQRTQGMIVGHNAVLFDARWLDNELRGAGMPGWSGVPMLDTMILARVLFERHGQTRWNLDACREFFGLPPEGVHTAEGGVRATREYVEHVGDCAVLGRWVLEQFPGMTKREVCQHVLAKAKEWKVSNGDAT